MKWTGYEWRSRLVCSTRSSVNAFCPVQIVPKVAPVRGRGLAEALLRAR